MICHIVIHILLLGIFFILYYWCQPYSPALLPSCSLFSIIISMKPPPFVHLTALLHMWFMGLISTFGTCLPPMKSPGWSYSMYNVSFYTVHSFIVPYIWLSSGCRVREQMQREDSFIPPTLWEMGMWRVARLMYLTQWKPKAEPMKTPFQGG